MNVTQIPRGLSGERGWEVTKEKGQKKKETPSPMRRAAGLTQVPSRSMQDLGRGSSSLFFHPRWSAVAPERANERTKDGRTNGGCSSMISRSLQRLPHGPPARALETRSRSSRDRSIVARRVTHSSSEKWSSPSGGITRNRDYKIISLYLFLHKRA